MNVIVEITVVRVSEFYIALVDSWSPSITPGWVRRAASGTRKVFYAQLVPRWNTSMFSLSLVTSDVKFHEFFCLEIFHEIFLKYFWNISKISRCLFSGFTLTRLTVFLYVKHITFHSFMHTLSLSAGLLAWFACLSTVVSKGRQVLKYGHRYSTLALSNQCLGCSWKDGCCWTTDNIDQNTPNTNKSADIPFL